MSSQNLQKEIEEIKKTQANLLEIVKNLSDTIENNQAVFLNMLKACRKGYRNILEAQQYNNRRFEECMEDCQDMHNSIANINWAC